MISRSFAHMNRRTQNILTVKKISQPTLTETKWSETSIILKQRRHGNCGEATILAF
jgi:hypothetical protein